jgi:hypothetical protein
MKLHNERNAWVLLYPFGRTDGPLGGIWEPSGGRGTTWRRANMARPPTASATLHDREGIVPLWTVLSQGSPGLAESTGELHTGTRG